MQGAAGVYPLLVGKLVETSITETGNYATELYQRDHRRGIARLGRRADRRLPDAAAYAAGRAIAKIARDSTV